MKGFKLISGSVMIFLILFSASACQKKSKKHKKHLEVTEAVVYDTNLPVDSILPDLITRADSSIRFALYLPAGYNVKKNWPVIFVFDAQARGKLALKLYRNLAKKYGYILIGSNNSKNRVDWNENKEQINKLLNDAFGRFAIDKQRIYTMGFSGGARVACLVGAYLVKVQGVIGCAAGFPQLDKPIENPFIYIGFSGNTDFNRVEMLKLDETLSTSGMPYYIRYYQGKHDWPPADIMNDGFIWMEFGAFKNNPTLRNDAIIGEYKKQIDEECNREKKAGNSWELYSSLKRGYTFLYGLTDISNLTNEMKNLEQSEKIIKLKAQQKDIISRELSKQEEYRNDIGSKNIEWWKKEISSLNTKAADKKNVAEADLAKRLLNFISLVSNMNVNSSLSDKNPQATAFYLEIYSMADPKNPDYHYLAACFFAKQNNTEKTMSLLRNAVKYGYADKQNLLTNAAFEKFRNNKAFIDIINLIKD